MRDPYKSSDHHCSIIEKKRLKEELAACDMCYDNDEERGRCHALAMDESRKREFACQYS